MKKRIIIISVCVLALLAAILVPVILLSRPATGKVVVISLSGTITTDDSLSLSGSTITPGLVKSYLSKAEADKAVKAIILHIESSGGEIEPCQEILLEIERAKETKTIVVSMGEMAASGGYYISTAADKIVAMPTTQTGAIGVISAAIDVKGLLDKLGIQIEIFKGGKYKDMYWGLRELTPEEETIMQQMVDDYYQGFVDVVAEDRGLSQEDVKNLATGQLYSGTKAQELGLVDELGDLDTAINLAAELAGIKAPIVEYYKQPGLIGRLLSGLVDAIETRISGLSAQDMILLEVLSHDYPQPLFLYQS
ncbi:MAG TPA: signal peptide peptidase SppA [Dehalococcoidia bacterium]|nr:signal peptide peptidase SppA [Dehalococcoidia bacterium]